MKTLFKYLIQSIVCCLIISCNGIPGQEVNIPKKTQFKSTVKMNNQPFIDISTNDCETLGGYQIKSQNAINILATDENKFNVLQLFIYYKNISDLSPGKRLSVVNVNSGELLGFSVSVRDNSTGQNWQTGIEGKVSGSLTVKSFDSSTGLASFDLVFTAMLAQSSGQLLTNRTASFSGTFENVPIFSDENAWSNCATGKQGFDNNPSSGNGNTGNNGGSGGNNGGNTSSNTSLEYINKTHYAIDITLNGITKTAPYNGSAIFTGTASSKATGTATSNGKTSSGTQVGLKITWNLNHTFPTTGTQLVDLSAGSEVFFLQIINQSQTPMNKVIVNNGLQSQTVDNISIPADGKLYNIGYYKAFTNSNVRAEGNNNRYWTWPNLNLKFENNQLKTLTATGS